LEKEQVSLVRPYKTYQRSSDLEPNRGWRAVPLIAGTVALADWVTKALVASQIPVNNLMVVWDGRVALWHVKNPALILGLFGGDPLFSRKIVTAILGLAAVTLLHQVITRAHRLLPHRRKWAWLFAGLLFGGMLGNLGERVLHWWVTDFLSFRWGPYWLPPGNVADLSILIAIPLSVLIIVFEVEARKLRGTGYRAPVGLNPSSPQPATQGGSSSGIVPATAMERRAVRPE
jgi:lipoprotein signal peptidase